MFDALNLGSLGNFFTTLTAFFGAFLAALWLSLVFWTYRDARTRTQDRIVHILAALVVLVLNILGVVVYYVLRPRQTLDEAYQQSLEEEALLSQIESRMACPGCGANTQLDWQVCPLCHTRLRKPCVRCGKLMELPWQICPYCSTPASSNREDSSPSSNASPVFD
jgi:RNA polymerase subunit RPABC4/transcription elongation factor Spt4